MDWGDEYENAYDDTSYNGTSLTMQYHALVRPQEKVIHERDDQYW